MDILKSLVFRIFDLAIIWMLLSGQESWPQFAVFVCYVFVVLVFLGLVTLNKEAREVIDSFPGKTWLSLFVAWTFHLLYTGALIQSGHPILAGFYLLGFFILHARVSELRKESANGPA